MKRPGYLVLQNGQIFKGELFGKGHETYGELVFTTGMVGYLETLTDKSFYGQIIVQSFPLIGNYGVITDDFESDKIYASGYIVKEICSKPSNFRSEMDLETFFNKNEKLGLAGVDTRSIVKTLRENGCMNAVITDNLDSVDHEKLKTLTIRKAVETVSCKKPKSITKTGNHHVVVWDFGTKANIVRELEKRGCQITLVPQNSTAEEILGLNPDGILLSNGPGDPAENTEVISNIRKLIPKKIPTFGICLGHQLLALANGFRTEPIKYGHRGANQPVKDITTNRVYITSQNHGYVVVKETIDSNIAKEFLVNANDNTNEGIIYDKNNAFTCQFHPEGCCGPHDTKHLFDRFINLMDKGE